ncbi:hypothetical protein GFB56_09890 [Ensifer sp. T173]|uniref:Uncharacterized protein n=1 Tax=Ensifer canadensis TaxID=555315 RepID=A0AAW4FGA0_9HYPH|nr:hypothetical protein [Ensifer canadensis]MBM3091127.1 hypothetical protein [Ensifer canadensis]UBI75819.1 hypothetical protein J3R84_01265 [Ensifer canadensis]
MNHRHADFQSSVIPAFSVTSTTKSVKLKIEDQSLTAGLSNADAVILVAAKWLVDHRDSIVGPILPALKERFGLRNIEAIEAMKAAHALSREAFE